MSDGVSSPLCTEKTHEDEYKFKFPLHECAKRNNFKYLETLIAQGGLYIDGEDFKKYTPAMYAIKKKNYDCLLALLNVGCDTNRLDTNGDSLLHQAAKIGDLIAILTLSTIDINYKIKNKMGLIPIMSAFEGKNSQVINFLWEKTNDDSFILSQVTNYGHRFVHFCAASADSSILRKVLNMSVRDMLPQTESGWLSPMHISVLNNIFENFIQLYSFYPQQACMWDSLGELPVHKVKNLNILKYCYAYR